MSDEAYRIEGDWIIDTNGNQASIEYWGSEAAAIEVLKTVKNCRQCWNCCNCEWCDHCVECHRCFGCAACINCKDTMNGVNLRDLYTGEIPEGQP